MSFNIKKAAIKSLLPMVIDFLPVLDSASKDYCDQWAKRLNIEPGEQITGMLFNAEGKMYITICVLSADNFIKKQVETLTFSDFVIKLINEFKKS